MSPVDNSSSERVVSFFSPLLERSRGNSLSTRAYFEATSTARYLLAAWVTLWAVAFAAVGLFAGASKSWAIQMKRGLDAWAARLAQRRSDERLWAIAQTDARLMSELQIAMSRSDEETLLGESSTQRRVSRLLRQRQFYI